ncbi:hypothetical protein CL656_07100 [bacterium]|nr:hypothetical protein [bacterium]|tara:strand:- start:1303 stop:1671 length:369 start_codon:yes stop_codon:yes gene_type:complete
MKKNKGVLSNLLLLFDMFFKRSIYIIYLLYVLIFLYYFFLLLNKKFSVQTILNEELIIRIKHILEILHFVTKIFIALYLIIKFNPFYKIRYNNKNDKNIIFNSGVLLLTSIILVDPLLWFGI